MLVRAFIYISTMCMQAAKALVRLHICAGSYDSLLPEYAISTKISHASSWVIVQAFLSSADFFQNQLFQKILSEIPSECQTVCILIRPNILSGLIWVQTVCKGYQQTKLEGKELNKKIKISFINLNALDLDMEKGRLQ